MVDRLVSLRQEVTELLQELIRLDTVNPPGNETRAAEALERYLAGNGVVTRRIAKTPDRANIVALDLVEVNPVLDSQNMTGILAAELAQSALGKTIL